MICWFTVSIGAALANARIDAISVFACLIETALSVVRTFTSSAVAERVSRVARRTRTDRPTSEGFLADGVCTARVAGTALTWEVMRNLVEYLAKLEKNFCFTEFFSSFSDAY